MSDHEGKGLEYSSGEKENEKRRRRKKRRKKGKKKGKGKTGGGGRKGERASKEGAKEIGRFLVGREGKRKLEVADQPGEKGKEERKGATRGEERRIIERGDTSIGREGRKREERRVSEEKARETKKAPD